MQRWEETSRVVLSVKIKQTFRVLRGRTFANRATSVCSSNENLIFVAH